jgi:hypothetical protein
MIDQICDDFELKWSSGFSPRIEVYLRPAPRVIRARLFRELLLLDIAYRSRNGDHPSAWEYHGRFPHCPRAIEQVFDDAAELRPAFPDSGILTNWATTTLGRQGSRRIPARMAGVGLMPIAERRLRAWRDLISHRLHPRTTPHRPRIPRPSVTMSCSISSAKVEWASCTRHGSEGPTELWRSSLFGATD